MKKKVLIVDDDPRNIFALKLTLQSKGFLVESCMYAQEALSLLEKVKDFDVILMDMMMPEMDGYQAIKTIQADSSINSIPVIAVTAQAMPEDREKCLQAGAADYVPKPIDVDVLINAIEKLN